MRPLFRELRCVGAARDAGDDNALTLCFDRPLSDDEMRRLQDHVKAWLAGQQRTPPEGQRFW